MELRYCDGCQKVLTEKDEALKLPTQGYLCRECSLKKGVTQKATDAAGSLEASEDKPRHGGKAEFPRMELSYESLLNSGDLDLYSAETVIKRKREIKRGSKTKIRLLDPDTPAPSSVTEEKGEAASKRASPEAMTPGSEVAPSPKTGISKLSFVCPSCQATLAIKQVDRPSRLRCPECRSHIAIDPGKGVRLIKSDTQVIKKSSVGIKPQVEITGAPPLSRNPRRSPPPAEPGFTKGRCEEKRKCQGPSLISESKKEQVAADQAELSGPATGLKPGSESSPSPSPPEISLSKSPKAISTPNLKSSGREAGHEGGGFWDALFLSLLLTLPFCLWLCLVPLTKATFIGTYVEQMGKIVGRAFRQIFGL